MSWTTLPKRSSIKKKKRKVDDDKGAGQLVWRSSSKRTERKYTMNDDEPDGFAEAIQQQTDEAKTTMMSWTDCRVNPASKRKKREVDAR